MPPGHYIFWWNLQSRTLRWGILLVESLIRQCRYCQHITHILYVSYIYSLQFHLPVMSTLGGSAIVEVWISDFLNQAGFCNIIFLNIILRPNRTAIMFTLKNVNWKKNTCLLVGCTLVKCRYIFDLLSTLDSSSTEFLY